MPKSKKKSSAKFNFKLEFSYLTYLLRRLFFNKLVKIVLITLISFFIIAVILFLILRPKIQENINYGVNFSNKYASDLGMNWQDSYIEILDVLNVKNIRLVAYWDEIEQKNGTYDFTNITWQLNEAQRRDINVILVVGRKVPRYPECHEPSWWRNMTDKKAMDEELYQYIEDSVSSLKDYSAIKTWQVENEPFFPFGDCEKISLETVKKEVEIVRGIDSRPILIQDSGEGGIWFPSYNAGDYLGISMYRRIWYNFWNVFFGRFIYFEYPLSYWSYKIKAGLVGIPYEKVIVTELQAEPWGPAINSELSQSEKDKTMSKHDFLTTITYAQKAGFKDLYFWGAEWWLYEKNVNNNSYFWDTAKVVIED